MRAPQVVAAAIVIVSSGGQSTNNPFSTPIPAVDGAITVRFVEFAVIPDISGEAPRMMRLLEKPGGRRLFVNTMRGPLYSVSYDGKTIPE